MEGEEERWEDKEEGIIVIYLFGSPADQVFLPSGIVVMSYISDRSIWCQPAADKTPCEESAAVGAPLYTSLGAALDGYC